MNEENNELESGTRIHKVFNKRGKASQSEAIHCNNVVSEFVDFDMDDFVKVYKVRSDDDER